MISLLDPRDKNKFMIVGKTRMVISIEPNTEFNYCYKVIPIETGKYKLPGVLVEAMYQNAKDKVFLFDSSNTKTITILPENFTYY